MSRRRPRAITPPQNDKIAMNAPRKGAPSKLNKEESASNMGGSASGKSAVKRGAPTKLTKEESASNMGQSAEIAATMDAPTLQLEE